MIGLGRSDGFKAVAFISIEWNPIGYDLGHFHWKFAIVVIIELVRLTHVATSAICAVLPSHTASLAYRSSSSLFVYLWARSFQRWQALHSWHIYQSDSAVSKTLSESTEFTRFFARLNLILLDSYWSIFLLHHKQHKYIHSKLVAIVFWCWVRSKCFPANVYERYSQYNINYPNNPVHINEGSDEMAQE